MHLIFISLLINVTFPAPLVIDLHLRSNLRTTSFDLRKRLHKKITTPISDVVVKDAGDEGSDRAGGEGASFFE